GSLEIEKEGFIIRMRKSDYDQDTTQLGVSPEMQPTQPQPMQKSIEDSSNLEKITSPLVGVFYAAKEPGKPAFVKEGQTIKKGQVLCLIEAMKIISELKSTKSGVIKKIHAKDGDTVEYEQCLFEVEPC
ncbi:MAG: acetyl-CoA carboxylase biotin carboxyl carrier protein subunit, partial [Anaerovoracaceae bacterium]